MAQRKLALAYSRQALADLDDIWEWNAQQKNVQHANVYIAFLRAETSKLTRYTHPGRQVTKSTNLRYALIRKRRKGHGHLVVFSLHEEKLLVLRYFHTAQDWQIRS